MEPAHLDLVTLATLSGDAATRHLLKRLDADGHAGIRASHGYVFQRLLAGQPTIGELAASLGITQQGASKHVADLERLGLAERIPDAGDNRARRVRLTPAGRRAIDAARTARAELERELDRRFGPDDVATARRVLAGLLDATGETPRVRARAVPIPES